MTAFLWPLPRARQLCQDPGSALSLESPFLLRSEPSQPAAAAASLPPLSPQAALMLSSPALPQRGAAQSLPMTTSSRTTRSGEPLAAPLPQTPSEASYATGGEPGLQNKSLILTPVFRPLESGPNPLLILTHFSPKGFLPGSFTLPVAHLGPPRESEDRMWACVGALWPATAYPAKGPGKGLTYKNRLLEEPSQACSQLPLSSGCSQFRGLLF